MSNQLMLDVDQAGELKAAFRRGEWTNGDIKRLCEGDILKQMRDVVLGRAIISVVKHVIDCDADPFIPNGWKVEEHRKGGQLEWDATKVTLHLSKNQMGDKVIEGNKLRKELANTPVMNANVLDYLIAHPQLIPDEWKQDEQGKTRYIFFWGTIYRRSDGRLCVRCLYWRDGAWGWGSLWLDDDWCSDNPSAVLAS